MIAFSTTALQRFTPPHRAADPSSADPAAPVYLVRAGSVDDRDTLESELAAPPFNAGVVYWNELREAIEDGARTVITAPEDLGRVLEAVAMLSDRDCIVAEALARAGQASAQQLDLAAEFTRAKALVAQIEEVLGDAWPPYAALMRQKANRQQRLPTVATRRFLRGWENVFDAAGEPVPFKIGIDGLVSAETLRAMDPLDLRVTGLHVYGLLYAETARPFSPPPSKSESAPAISTAGGARRTAAAGKSTARSTAKTPR